MLCEYLYAMLESTRNGREKQLFIDRFLEKIERTRPHRFNGGAHITVR